MVQTGAPTTASAPATITATPDGPEKPNRDDLRRGGSTITGTPSAARPRSVAHPAGYTFWVSRRIPGAGPEGSDRPPPRTNGRTDGARAAARRRREYPKMTVLAADSQLQLRRDGPGPALLHRVALIPGASLRGNPSPLESNPACAVDSHVRQTWTPTTRAAPTIARAPSTSRPRSLGDYTTPAECRVASQR